MTAGRVKNLCEASRTKLNEAIAKMEHFLNHYSLPQLLTENDPDSVEFYRSYLSDCRHLLVYCEVAYEKVGIALRRPTFNDELGEKALYEVYQNCVNTFYHPKNECYSEDGRYAYTGQDAIRFRMKPGRDVRNLTIELSVLFEELRDELSYYETEYMAQRRKQGERV